MSARWLLVRIAALLAAPVAALAADEDDAGLEWGWLAFGDVYAVPRYHDPALEDAAGAVVRRVYLTFDADFGRRWFGRLRFEANQSGEFEDYDFEADVKDFHIGRDFGDHRLLIGLAPTPTFDVIEDAWGLRYLAKTPMDLQGLPSRDTGVSLRGPLTADGRFAYRVMAGTGDDIGAGGGDGDKLMSAVTWQPAPAWTVDLYADYESLPGPSDRRTLQAFLAYDTEDLRFGLQYSDQDRGEDPPVELVSGFLVARTGAATNAILRIDRLLEPSARGDDIDYLPFDPSAEAMMLIAGFEFAHGPHYRVTPNVVAKWYGEDAAGERPETDVHLRLTFFLDFE